MHLEYAKGVVVDHLTVEELKQLLGRYPGWCISLYMPTHRTGQDTEQDPIRLKNLLREAEERLLAKDLRKADVDGILERARALLIDPVFRRHQSDGLALFASAERMITYRLPIRFDELVVVSDNFHLKPLLQYFANDGHFYILALSQNQVRLLEGTRHTVDEVPIESMPDTMADALQFDRFEKHLNLYTGTAEVYHGFNATDDEKNRILRWFHKVDEELIKYLAGEHSPLVLAGVEYYFPLYQSASAYPHILDDGVPGNPDLLKPEEFHAGAWPLVEPIFKQKKEDAIDRYHQLSATERTTTDLVQIVQSAFHGRVDTVFMPVDIQVWGQADLGTGEVTVHPDHESGDEDLLDLAAVQTFINQGEVFVFQQAEMPVSALVAAILRY